MANQPAERKQEGFTESYDRYMRQTNNDHNLAMFLARMQFDQESRRQIARQRTKQKRKLRG